MKTPDIQQWKVWKVAAFCVATAIFGFIPGMGIPGALVLILLLPLPFISRLMDFLPGDVGWAAAIYITFVAPIIYFVVFLFMRGLKSAWLTVKRRFWIFALIVYLAWYCFAFLLMYSYVRQTERNPRYGSMMEYLP